MKTPNLYLINLFVILICKFIAAKNPPYGQLHIEGKNLKNSTGSIVQLKGMSLFDSQLEAYFYNKKTIESLKKDWNCDVVRAALGVHGYLAGSDNEYKKIRTVVEAAIEEDIYVIVSWHYIYSSDHELKAIEFFDRVSKDFGNYSNIIYDICNAPDSKSWPILKNFAEKMIHSIRKNDPNNIIVVSTPEYSANLNAVAKAPINLPNIAYAFIFFAGTRHHQQEYRNRIERGLESNLPIFITEYATVEVGDKSSDVNEDEIKKWWKFLDERKISYVNWALIDEKGTVAAVIPGTLPGEIGDYNKWTTSGKLVHKMLTGKTIIESKIIVRVIVGVIGILLLIFLILLVVKKIKKMLKSSENNGILISNNDLTFLRIIGSGNFGVVQEARWRKNDKEIIRVAVKTFKTTEGQNSQGNMDEMCMEVLNTMGLDHENVIKLHGIVKANPMLMIMEFCEGESLKMRLGRVPKLLVTEINEYARQIASGMKYLSEKNIVHRDLAARNIMMSGDYKTIKIADFGLSRIVSSDHPYYVKTENSKFHQKWTAPEFVSDKYNKFSTYSDVWSFGVILWEMYSYGEEPWKEVSDIFERIKNGDRLRKPMSCPPDIYDLMSQCWLQTPEMRPNFNLIERTLRNYQFKTVEYEDISEGNSDFLKILEKNGKLIIIEKKQGNYYCQCLNSHNFGLIDARMLKSEDEKKSRKTPKLAKKQNNLRYVQVPTENILIDE